MPDPLSGIAIPVIDPLEVLKADLADDGSPGSVLKQGANAVEQAQKAAGQGPQGAGLLEGKATYVFKLLNAAGEPVKFEKCRVTLPDGTVKAMQTNAKGVIRLDDVDPGEVTIAIPGRYDYEWGPGGVEEIE